MKKSRIQISVDPQVVEEFDRVVENRSGKIEDLMRKIADMENSEDSELKDRLEEIEERRGEISEELEDLQQEDRNLEAEAETIRSTLEKKEEKNNSLNKASQVIAEDWQEKRKSRVCDSNGKAFKMLFSSEKFHMWNDKVEASKEELKEAVKAEVKEEFDRYF